MLLLQDNVFNRQHDHPTILVMEDEFSVAKGLEMVLSEEGYEVDLAMNGRSALEQADHKDFDLLVADLRLPDISGLEVIRSVKSHHPETGVVVITGYASVDSAVDAMKMGIYDYLPKPFTEDQIKEAVNGALKSGRSISSQKIIHKVEEKEKEHLIEKREILSVLARTVRDELFWEALMECRPDILSNYNLSSEARAAIMSGDLKWLREHIDEIPEAHLEFIYKRGEREAW